MDKISNYDTSLKMIFRILQNQGVEIFNGNHNQHAASIMTCLKNLATKISPDDTEYIEELEMFIDDGACRIARNYGKNTDSTVSPIVLNFLMTAIHSYNHINKGKTPYQFTGKKNCTNIKSSGKAFLAQVLIPRIHAGAHAYPTNVPLLTFHAIAAHSPIMRSPSPNVGPRHPPISFGKSAKRLQRERRQERKLIQGYRSNSSDTGSASDGGGKRRFTRRRQQK